MLFPFFLFFVHMNEYHRVSVLIKDPTPISIIEILRTADLHVNTKMFELEIRCPHSWPLIFIPNKHRLFKGPLDTKLF